MMYSLGGKKMGYKIICTMLSHHKQELNFITYEQKCPIYFKTAGTWISGKQVEVCIEFHFSATFSPLPAM